MANRVIRDWTNSEKVDLLSYQAEVFFTRLCMKADDHGIFVANLKILRSQLFSLRTDKIKIPDIQKWLLECVVAGIVKTYWHMGKEYLIILDFGQRLRNMRSKYVLPQDADNVQTIDRASQTNSSNPPPESETETEGKQNLETETLIPPLEEFLEYCKQNLKASYPDLKSACEMKYNSWKEAKWHTGKGKKILNWKTTILHTIPHLVPIYRPDSQSQIAE